MFLQKSIPVAKDNIPTEEDLKKWPNLKKLEKLETIKANIGQMIGANAPKVMEPLSHPASGEGNVTLLHRTFKPKGWQGTELQRGF